MVLGALIHLGADADAVASELHGLGAALRKSGIDFGEFHLHLSTVERQGVSGYAASIQITGWAQGPAQGEDSHGAQGDGSLVSPLLPEAEHGAHSHSHAHTSGAQVAQGDGSLVSPLLSAAEHGAHSHSHAHTSYREIRTAIDNSEIGAKAKGYAQAAYRAIAVAEAAAHGTALEDIHFHEVGSARTIYAIVGAAIAADMLAGKYGVTGFTCGTLMDGSGTIVCSHGTIPVPVPAVRELLKQTDIPLVSDPDIKTELVTPSGLGLLIGLGCRAAQAPEAQETTPPLAAQVTTQMPEAQEAMQPPAAQETTPTPEAPETTQAPEAQETTPPPAAQVTTQMPAAQETTQTPAAQETTQAPEAQETTPAPEAQEAMQMPEAQEAGQPPAAFQRTGYGFGTRDTGLLGAVRAILY
jgi:uncharacterized protein (DUF111 family)